MCEPPGRGEVYGYKYHQLVDLGFRPLGIYWERLGWSLTSKEYVFARPGTSCMAYITSRSHTVYFITGFVDGAIVITNDNADGEDFMASDYWSLNVPGCPLREVLAEHEDEVERFATAKQQERLPTATLGDFLKLARAAAVHPEACRKLRSLAGCMVGVLAGLYTFLAAAVGFVFGFDSLAPWLALLAAATWGYWQFRQSSVFVPLPTAAQQQSDTSAGADIA